MFALMRVKLDSMKLTCVLLIQATLYKVRCMYLTHHNYGRQIKQRVLIRNECYLLYLVLIFEDAS